MAIEKKIKISVDYQEAINAFNNITEAEKKVGKTAEDVSRQIKTAFKPTEVRNFNQETTRTRGIIEKLENQLKQFRLDKKEALTTSDIEKFNQKISETQRKLQDLNNKGLKEVNKTTSTGVGIFKNLLGTITAVFAVDRVVAFAKASFLAYEQQQKAERVLLAALNNREDAYKRLVKQAKSLQERAAIDDETIMSIQTFYAQQGLTEKQIIKTTEAAVRLSKVTGQDLQTVMLQLAGTYEGTLGRLGKLDSGFRKLTLTQLENGAAIDMVLKKYSNDVLEKTVTDTERLSVAWHEFSEVFGQAISQVITPALKSLTSALKGEFLDAFLRWAVFSNMGITNFTNATNKNIQETIDYLKKFDGQVKRSVDEIRNNASDLLASKKFTDQAEALRFSLNKFLKETKTDIKQWYEYSGTTMPLVFVNINDAISKEVNDIIENIDKVERLGFKPLEEEISKLNVQLQQAIINGNELQEKHLTKLIETKTRQLKIYQNLFDELTKPIPPKRIDDVVTASIKAREESEKLSRELKKVIDYIFGSNFTDSKLPEAIDKIATPLTEAKKKLDASLKKEPMPLWMFLGLPDPDTSEGKRLYEAYKGIAENVKNSIDQIAQAEVDAADRQVETLNRLYQEKQTALANEIALNKAGFASNVELRQKELAQIESDRQKALAAQKKALKQQQQLQTIEQTFSLVTATANIIKEWSSLGPLGIVGAIASIATMFAAFAKARIEATNATKFAKGGLLEGKSHAQGGIYIPELNSEVEGGEYVTNKKSTRKYFPLIEALNKDNPRMIEIALDKQLGRNLERKQNIINKIEVKGGDEEARTLKNIEKLLSRNEVFYGNGFKIERIGNVVRKINV